MTTVGDDDGFTVLVVQRHLLDQLLFLRRSWLDKLELAILGASSE